MPTTKQDLSALTKLGKTSAPSRTLEVFPSHGANGMEVTLHCSEFTCVCPLTGQPDFATIEISYVPDKFIVESKSMKLYLETFRNVGIFHEHLAVDIGKDFLTFVKPKSVSVTVRFNVRGGIAIDAVWKS
ncbi:NADPH-dependent 7-cyano-7-deazaguanine reductase QueF [Candidatus Peribacteria bacterium]|nr:NADPH-dependent 7-cyano-7-deazaguanine reductase QueF [Candidatus Peribacteria bacterium]